MKTLQERFDEKWIPITESGCWIWTGYADDQGRGQIRINGATKRAHRISWELTNGPIPDGLHCLHHCDVPSCVNPDHLYIGTHQDNMDDMTRRGRRVYPIIPDNSGENHGLSKLTKEKVLLIRRYCDLKKWPQRTISKLFGICNQHVSDIHTRKRWCHI